MDLIEHLETRGYRARVVPVSRLADLRSSIERLRAEGVLSRSVYDDYLTGFEPGPPADMPDARSLIIVAFADPNVRFFFEHRGGRVEVVVPATYLHPIAKDDRAGAAIAEALEPEGFRVLRISGVPRKLLATSSGLSRYGLNNVTYVDGLGSFHRLAAFVSDMPCSEECEWIEPRVLDRCGRCGACVRACPTGAIDAGRFVIHAERCLTYLNEKDSAVPFPDWLDPTAHNCLVGCLRCQKVCPEDREYLGLVVDGEELTGEETEALLAGTPLDKMPAGLRDKLVRSDLASVLEVVPRNLAALLAVRA